MILYKAFRSNLIDFGAGIIFGNMGVSDHRAEMPIKKRKNISDCPGQGSLSVAFTNASVLGRCYIVRSQPAASVAVCACAWEKKKRKDKNNQPTPPACGQKCRGDPDCFRKDFTGSAKGYAAGGSGAPGGSMKALSQDWLCNTDSCYAPRTLPPPPARAGSLLPGRGTARDPRLRRRFMIRVCGKLSTNLPAVLNYLNVSKLSAFNVYKYILLKKIVVYRPTTNICMCLCIYIQGYVCVCVCMYIGTHTNTNVYIYVFSQYLKLSHCAWIKKTHTKKNHTKKNPKNGGKKKRKKKSKSDRWFILPSLRWLSFLSNCM